MQFSHTEFTGKTGSQLNIQTVHSIFNFNSITIQSQWFKNIFCTLTLAINFIKVHIFLFHKGQPHYYKFHNVKPCRNNKHKTNSLKTVLHNSRLSSVHRILLQFNSSSKLLALQWNHRFCSNYDPELDIPVIHSTFCCTTYTVKYFSPIFSTSPWGNM